MKPCRRGKGLVLGTVRHPAINTGSKRLGNHYAQLPAGASERWGSVGLRLFTPAFLP